MLTLLMRSFFWMTWITVIFMPKKSLKKYLPVTIFSGLYTVTITLIGHEYNFWQIEGGSTRKRMWNHLSLILGAFTAANLWIFHFSFGKFLRYCLINLVNNLIYGFGIIPILEKLNFLKYVKFTKYHHMIFTMAFSMLFYGYQVYFGKPWYKRALRFIK